jgi:ABC-type antimicrobial peptide transport system permease subunit
MSTSWLIFFAILAGVLVLGSIIAIGLGFGIGGYLAAKSLLLGVSPAAMEKERDRRERKRIRTQHKLAKRRIAMQRKKKLQLAKLERGSERAVAQANHQSPRPRQRQTPAAGHRLLRGRGPEGHQSRLSSSKDTRTRVAETETTIPTTKS